MRTVRSEHTSETDVLQYFHIFELTMSARNKLAHTRHFFLCYSYSVFEASVFFFIPLSTSSSSFVAVVTLRALSYSSFDLSFGPKRKKYVFCTDIIHHSRSVSRRSRIQKLSQYAVKRLLCVLFVFLSIKKIILSNLCIVFGGHKNSFFRYHFNVSKDQRREI